MALRSILPRRSKRPASRCNKNYEPRIYGNLELGVFAIHPCRFPWKVPCDVLYFSDPWFGKHNWGNGGPGSRIFNVSCNGNMILKNFDIIAEGGYQSRRKDI